MADTFTAFLNMTLPEIGASDDTWGDKLNDNLDIIDALCGPSGEGTLITRDANDDALVTGVSLKKAAGNARLIKIRSADLLRWDIGADATAEGGSNAGSLFKINRYDDLGSLLGTSLTIARDTGAVTFEVTPKVGGNDVIHKGNISNIPLPIGTPIPWLLDTLPSSGYLWMNGQTVSRTVYSDLFTLLGVKFGVGDGSTTFGLPDWREVVPVGKSTMGGLSARGLVTHLTLTDPAAAPVGEAKHVMATGELIEHDHAVYLKDNQHTHGVSGGTIAGTGSYAYSANNIAGPQGTATIVINNASSNITIGSVSGTANDNKTAKAGSATPAGMNVMQPSTVCNWIIKALA
ncbi:phage tail protein [Bradyrhizobium sp. NP1]|uniref:phage tail protein n=1 Tax=Bradyrhizobium sp. NP1 TaxID=3049772 RepID=UPI0025A529D2|nr:phage tail protein [Bradyrhizobium sp. NP1]WJR78775.1 phage tail protein [Bradyrhizobium sp. NP1]